MVALVQPNVLYNPTIDPAILRIVTIEVRKVSTGDTLDVGTQMATPRMAFFRGITAVVNAAVAITGTVLTLPAGLTNDSGYLVVLGL